MKNFFLTVIVSLFVVGAVSAQSGLSLSGEMRTGLFWYNMLREGEEANSAAFLFNSADIDQTGLPSLYQFHTSPARLRLDFHYTAGIIGTRFRFETATWPMAAADQDNRPFWSFAFVYGNFLDQNLRVSAGKLGLSPWGMGTHEIWNDLDSAMGMRFEFTPQFIPFIVPGSLNIGFVLNSFNHGTGGRETSLVDVLSESVFGFSYTHDFFHARFSYRLDSEVDGDQTGVVGQGDSLMFRVEERILQNFLPGFQIWINGFHWGFRSDLARIAESITRLYFQYETDLFVSQLRLGHTSVLDKTRLVGRGTYVRTIEDRRHIFSVQPRIFFRLFGNFLQAGTTLGFAAEVGDVRMWSDAPFQHWFIEPQIVVNLHPNANIGLVYRFYSDYEHWLGYHNNHRAVNTRTHWLNLRVLFTF